MNFFLYDIHLHIKVTWYVTMQTCQTPFTGEEADPPREAGSVPRVTQLRGAEDTLTLLQEGSVVPE